MEKDFAVLRLSALAHEGRLDVFRALVRAGADGLSAGAIAEGLSLPPNTLSAQLSILTTAGLISRQRKGRSIIYRADLKTLNELVLYLIEDCCEGRDEVCEPILEALQSACC